MKLLILIMCLNGFSSLLLVTVSAAFDSPGSFNESKIKFYFWNKKIREQEITVDNLGSISLGQTKFLIHGYMDSGNGEDFMFYGPMVQKYIKMGANVICVDWSYYSRRIYHESALMVKSVAELVAKLVMQLKKKKLILFGSIHLIGHSLGAHISGFIGKYIQENNNGQKIGRISGLDPAGPLFHRRPDSDRLCKDDATNVDTIIGDVLLFGMNQTLGHVNFYVWCGGQILLLNFNHILTPFYYAYGIDRKDLIGKQCQCKNQKMEECQDIPINILGQNTDFGKPGNYYLNIDITAMLNDAKAIMRDAFFTKIKADVSTLIKTIIKKVAKIIFTGKLT